MTKLVSLGKLFSMTPIALAAIVVALSCSDIDVNFPADPGTVWEIRSVGKAEKLVDVAWSGTRYVAVGGHQVLASANGYNWQLTHTYDLGELHGVCWSGEEFIAVGDSVVLTSLDGNTWSSLKLDGILRDVVTQKGMTLAVGDSGLGYFSTDGNSWTQTNPPISCRALAVDFDAGDTADRLFFAGGEDFRIVHTSNCVSWDYTFGDTSLAGSYLRGLAYGGSARVGVGDRGLIVGAGDDVVGLTSNTLRSVATNSVLWAIVGDGGVILWRDVSDYEKSTFTVRKSPTKLDLNAVIWVGEGFIAVGDSGVVLASPPPR